MYDELSRKPTSESSKTAQNFLGGPVDRVKAISRSGVSVNLIDRTGLWMFVKRRQAGETRTQPPGGVPRFV
jgi:hypothetical protein